MVQAAASLRTTRHHVECCKVCIVWGVCMLVCLGGDSEDKQPTTGV
jgi:hypothetical protein